jgi:hypothetical protein
MTMKTTVFTKGGSGNNASCMLCESASFAQRERLYFDEHGLPVS